jgi:hypothetical protein
MNHRIFQTLSFLGLSLLMSHNLQAQCNTTLCTIPVPSVDARDACILPNPAALNCYHGTLLPEAPISLPDTWCIAVENNQFFAFIADSSTVRFKLCCGSCESGGGIQAAILSTADCIDLVLVSPCLGTISSGTCEDLIAENLNVGSVYYLMIDGYSGSLCHFVINAENCSAATEDLVETATSSLKIYPNPVSKFETEITVEVQNPDPGACLFMVSDLAGRVYLRKNVASLTGKTVLDIGELPTGSYLIQAVQAGKMVSGALFLKV